LTARARPVWRVRWQEKIIFYPVHLTLFTSYFNVNEEYELRFYSYSYDPYPGSGYYQQFEEMASASQSSSSASGASNNTNASRAKSARLLNGPKITSCCRAESQEHAALRKICDGRVKLLHGI